MVHQLTRKYFTAFLLATCLCATALGASQSNKAQSNNPAPAAAQPKKEKPMKFNKVTPNLICSDLDKSLKFYRDVLGFTIFQSVPEKAPFVFTWLKRDDAEIFLNQHFPPQPGQPDVFAGKQIGGTLTLYFAMDGIDDLLKSVESKGVKIAIPMHKEFYGMKEFAVQDPDGYLLIFAERVE